MISDQNIKLLNSILKLLFKFKIFPLYWDSRTRRYICHKQRAKFSFIYLAAVVAHLALPAYNFANCDRSGCSSFEKSLFIINIILTTGIILPLSLYTFSPSNQLVEVHNSIDFYIRNLKRGRYILPVQFANSRYFKLIDKLALIVVSGLNLLSFLISIQCWVFPSWGIYFTTFIQPWYYFPLRVCIQSCYSIMIVASFLLIGFLFTTLLVNISFCIRMIKNELRPGLRRDQYIMRDGVRRIPNLVLFYRETELLLKLFLDYFGVILVPGEALLILTVMTFSSCLILFRKEYDAIQLSAFSNGLVACLTVLILFFEISGRFELYSRKTLAIWRKHYSNANSSLENSRERKYFLKFVKSCKSLCIGYKGYRKTNRLTVLVLIRRLARNVFRTLASFRR